MRKLVMSVIVAVVATSGTAMANDVCQFAWYHPWHCQTTTSSLGFDFFALFSGNPTGQGLDEMGCSLSDFDAIIYCNDACGGLAQDIEPADGNEAIAQLSANWINSQHGGLYTPDQKESYVQAQMNAVTINCIALGNGGNGGGTGDPGNGGTP